MEENDKRNKAEQAAQDLWPQGIRSSDATIIHLCYGYSEAETAAICDCLACMEKHTKPF